MDSCLQICVFHTLGTICMTSSYSVTAEGNDRILSLSIQIALADLERRRKLASHRFFISRGRHGCEWLARQRCGVEFHDYALAGRLEGLMLTHRAHCLSR